MRFVLSNQINTFLTLANGPCAACYLGCSLSIYVCTALIWKFHSFVLGDVLTHFLELIHFDNLDFDSALRYVSVRYEVHDDLIVAQALFVHISTSWGGAED